MAQGPITLTQNEFLTGLTNLALFMRIYATNTSSKPSDFVDSFVTDTITNGNTKIFPWSEIPNVTDYSETSSLLSVTKVEAGEEFLQINHRKVIKSSYSRYILSGAFTSDTGMNDFIGYILSQMESAKTDHLYNKIISNLFNKTYLKNTQEQSVNQYDLTGATDFQNLNAGQLLNQKNIAIALQNIIENVQVYNNDYSGLGHTQALSLDNMKIIFNEPYHNESVVNLMATLLNSKYINENFNRPQLYTIPSIKIPTGKNNIIGWLLHRYAYQIFYKFVYMGSFFDESNLVINNFLHFWYGEGWIENLPTVQFKTNIIALP